MFRFTFIAGFTSLIFLIQAQATSLSLPEAVQEGMNNSPVVQKAESEHTAAKWKKRETLNGFLPSISGGASYLTDHRYALTNVPGFASAIPQIVPTGNISLNATLPIFEGGAGWHRYAAG